MSAEKPCSPYGRERWTDAEGKTQVTPACGPEKWRKKTDPEPDQAATQVQSTTPDAGSVTPKPPEKISDLPVASDGLIHTKWGTIRPICALDEYQCTQRETLIVDQWERALVKVNQTVAGEHDKTADVIQKRDRSPDSDGSLGSLVSGLEEKLKHASDTEVLVVLLVAGGAVVVVALLVMRLLSHSGDRG